MGGWIASLGLRVIAGNALGNAKRDLAAIWRGLTGLNFYQLGCIALLIVCAWQTVGRWSQHRHTVKVERQLGDATKARDAAQANELTLIAAIKRETAAIDNLATASLRLQARAAKARQIAAPRAAEAEAVRDQLNASAKSPRASGADCDVSDTLKAQWK